MKKTKKKHLKPIIITLIILTTIASYVLIPWPTEEVPEKEDDFYRVVSYNLRYAEEWLDDFSGRKEVIANQIKDYMPDTIGVQEANYGWMNEYDGLPALLTDYSYVGVGREDGDTQGEYAAIFYLKDKFQLIDSGTFWLSETPDEISIGWDASTYRICTYAVLKNIETEEIITHYNTHLDHVGEDAIKNSVDLLLEVTSDCEYPYILTGDFNFSEFNKLYSKITEGQLVDSKDIAEDSMDYGTINWFKNLNFKHFITIDFVFMKKNSFNVLRYRVDNSYKYNGKPASDHFPVIVDYILK